jgi:hypothetical protein
MNDAGVILLEGLGELRCGMFVAPEDMKDLTPRVVSEQFGDLRVPDDP